MKPIQLQLSNPASAVLTEMARRGKVRPEDIARVVVERALADTVDLRISEDLDRWYMQMARDPSKACREGWRHVENPGSYGVALGKGLSPDVCSLAKVSARV
jgi:hypothetical protein